jgi:hypothetical protein
MEFRLWKEIVRVTERIAKKENDDDSYEKLSEMLYENERLTIDDFKVCIDLLFKYFIPRIFENEKPETFVELPFLNELDIKIDGVDYTMEDY